MKKDKIIGISIIILSIMVICLSSVQLLGLWEGVLLLLQSILFWNKNRKVAVFLLCASIFVFGVAILLLT